VSIEVALLTPHMPWIYNEANLADYHQQLVKDMHALRTRLSREHLDSLVLLSCHWVGPFHHYVNTNSSHCGVVTSSESPELLKGMKYNYKGDSELAKAIVVEGLKAELPVIAVEDPHLTLDYGALVPLKHLMPDNNPALITLSVTLASNLEESYRWGKTLYNILSRTDRRIGFIVSGSLSHNLVRGREKMPTPFEQMMDAEFIELLTMGQFHRAADILAQYTRTVGAESGGRHLAVLLGLLGERFQTQFFTYAQSSGSGNALCAFTPLH